MYGKRDPLQTDESFVCSGSLFMPETESGLKKNTLYAQAFFFLYSVPHTTMASRTGFRLYPV